MAQFRVCPDSGFYFDKSAESLMKANAVAGAVSLLIAGLLGLGVILTRWQEVHLLPADVFYQVLTGHGINALIFWIIFFEMAILYFASSTLLRTRLAAPRWAWAGFALMIIGMVMNNIAVLQGNSSVMMTSYAPMQAEPHFYLGLILFAVGALIGCFVFLGTLVIAKDDRTYEGSIPTDGMHYRDLHHCLRCYHPGAYLFMVDRLHQSYRCGNVPCHLVGPGALVATNQRRRACIGVVSDRRRAIQRPSDVGKSEPLSVSALHPVPATGQCAPYPGRSGYQL
jgi:hypothetical protein